MAVMQGALAAEKVVVSVATPEFNDSVAISEGVPPLIVL
jgi:hypothetical protein